MTPLSSNILAAWFLHPGFVWLGAGLVAVPILIHILNRQRFRTVQWAAMEYLLRAMRRNRKRLKMEQWLLLAVRCLVVALIGVALARPTAGCADNTVAASLAARSGVNVFVIDNSLSTAYEAPHPPVSTVDGSAPAAAKTHLDHEKLMAKRLIDTLTSGGESVAVITAARPATAVIARPGYNLMEAKAVIDRIEQSYSGTDLAGALTLANQIADDEPQATGRSLYLFTDGTRNAWEGPQAEALKRLGPEAARRYTVTHFNMTEGKSQWNDAVLDARPVSNLVTTRFESDLQAVVRGFGTGGGDASLQWTLDGRPLGQPSSLRPEPSTPPQTARLQPQAVKVGGAHLLAATLTGDRQGDPLKVDDRRLRVIDVASELKVLIVEGVRAQKFMESSGAFLQLALAPPVATPGGIGTPRSATHVTADLISDGELERQPLGDYRAVVLCGVPQFSAHQADALADFVKAGGTLMLFMGERVNKTNYNDVLLPRKLLPGPLVKLVDEREQGTGYVFDFNPSPSANLHRYLQSFKGEQNTGLDTARISAYWQADLAGTTDVERVLSYLPTPNPDGTPRKLPPEFVKDPAITSHALGLGTVVFVSTSASPTADRNWHNLPAKPAWVQLTHEILAGGVRSSDTWMNVQAGRPLEIPGYVKLAGEPELTDEAGAVVAVEHVTDPTGAVVYRSRPLAKPGVYQLKLGGGQAAPIAVNPSAEESDVRTVGNDFVRTALGGIQITLLGDVLPIEDVMAAKEDNDWASIILLILLGILGVEGALAMLFGHHRRQPTAAAS